jgi:hypothetical protein
MNCNRSVMIAAMTGVFAVVGGWAVAARDKYMVTVPGGLGISEFRGYEDWQPVGPSLTRPTCYD